MRFAREGISVLQRRLPRPRAGGSAPFPMVPLLGGAGDDSDAPRGGAVDVCVDGPRIVQIFTVRFSCAAKQP